MRRVFCLLFLGLSYPWPARALGSLTSATIRDLIRYSAVRLAPHYLRSAFEWDLGAGTGPRIAFTRLGGFQGSYPVALVASGPWYLQDGRTDSLRVLGISLTRSEDGHGEVVFPAPEEYPLLCAGREVPEDEWACSVGSLIPLTTSTKPGANHG